MRNYQAIIIGSGSGASILEHALAENYDVALIDKGPAGGTCLNFGCIPSKMLTAVADRVVEIKDSEKYGIKIKLEKLNYGKVMSFVKNEIVPESRQIHETFKKASRFDYYESEAFFIGERVLQVGNKKIKGDKIFICSGSRPRIPDLKGLGKVDYLTNENVLNLKKQPRSMIIIGGGYVALEYAHFFEAMGTKVSILQNGNRLVRNEEPEIADLLLRKMSERMDVYLETDIKEVKKNKGKVEVVFKKGEEECKVGADELMIAAGRKSNADLLKVENSKIELDENGFIRVNEFLETNIKNVWAIGDANGKGMFSHVSRKEANLVWQNNTYGTKIPFEYNLVPRSIFTYPPVASVGLTEEEAKESYNIKTGIAGYDYVAYGQAIREKEGFAKAVVDMDSGKIIGFHIVGPYASIIIQEVVNVMSNGGGVDMLARCMRVHPSISELVVASLSKVYTQ